MAKFKKFKRYDDTTAEEGVWFEIHDPIGQYYGSFKCRYLDPYSPKSELIMGRLRKKYAAAMRSKAMSELDAGRAVFVEGVLMDWKDVLDENDKPVPFKLADALEFFGDDDNRWLLNEISALANDVMNFQKIADVEEIEKN